MFKSTKLRSLFKLSGLTLTLILQTNGLLASVPPALAPELTRKINAEVAALSAQQQRQGKVTTNKLVITADNCPVLHTIIANLAQQLEVPTPEIVVFQSYRWLRDYDHWRLRYYPSQRHPRLIIGKKLLETLNLPELIALMTYELHDAQYQPQTNLLREYWQYFLLYDGALALGLALSVLTGPFAPSAIIALLYTTSAVATIGAGVLVTVPQEYVERYDLYRGQQCLTNVADCRDALLTIATHYTAERSTMLAWLSERFIHLDIIALAERQIAQQQQHKADFQRAKLLPEFKAV
ncbi:MAG TPA: hypothetical protein VJJ83_01220 [Candidatus Babeliales bacterium]|nr:hypothetical protein [Candidatus Babeliales bacterium]